MGVVGTETRGRLCLVISGSHLCLNSQHHLEWFLGCVALRKRKQHLSAQSLCPPRL